MRRGKKRFYVMEAIVLLGIIVLILASVDNRITGFKYERNKPSDTGFYSETAMAYKEACKLAVEEYFEKEVEQGYLRCTENVYEFGMYYYCKIGGTYYAIPVRGSAELNNRAIAVGGTLSEGNLEEMKVCLSKIPSRIYLSDAE